MESFGNGEFPALGHVFRHEGCEFLRLGHELLISAVTENKGVVAVAAVQVEADLGGLGVGEYGAHPHVDLLGNGLGFLLAAVDEVDDEI